jgi:hypothetical protein
MRSFLEAHIKGIDLPEPLRIMTQDRIEMKNLHKKAQLDYEHKYKQRSVGLSSTKRDLSNIRISGSSIVSQKYLPSF